VGLGVGEGVRDGVAVGVGVGEAIKISDKLLPELPFFPDLSSEPDSLLSGCLTVMSELLSDLSFDRLSSFIKNTTRVTTATSAVTNSAILRKFFFISK
jgi:hypothetical protein